jgi:hypothetical protein
MSKADVHQKLNGANEIHSVPKAEDPAGVFPVWCGLRMKATLSICFQFRASDTEWYKNMLADPMLKIL